MADATIQFAFPSGKSSITHLARKTWMFCVWFCYFAEVCSSMDSYFTRITHNVHQETRARFCPMKQLSRQISQSTFTSTFGLNHSERYSGGFVGERKRIFWTVTMMLLDENYADKSEPEWLNLAYLHGGLTISVHVS